MDNDYQITKIKDLIAEDQSINFCYLFGSRSGSTFKVDSDYDIAIYPVNSLNSKLDSLSYLSQIELKLEKLLGTDKIDLVDLSDATPLLRFKVLKNGIILVDKNKSLRASIETKWINEYLDIKPFLDYRNKIILEQLSKDKDVSR